MQLLEGKTVIITGASRGIGKAIAEVFASQGANIAFTYHSSEVKAKALEKELSIIGCKVKGYKSDASNFEAAQKLVEAVMEEFGSIDVLVNNAGITKDNLLMRMSEADFDSVMKVNMKSVFNLTKAVMRPMLKQRKGSIINMSSVVGVKGNAGQANYSASKAAIIGFTKSLSLELSKSNIRVNCVSPGVIKSPLFDNYLKHVTSDMKKKVIENHPLGIGSFKDINMVIKFLLSNESKWITGQNIIVDGGYTAQ